jgi:hypothetical protein
MNDWDELAALALIRLLCRDSTDDAIINLRLTLLDGEEKLIGKVAAEVADALGLHRRTARRRLWRIREDFLSHRRSGRHIKDGPKRERPTRGRQVAGKPHAGNRKRRDRQHRRGNGRRQPP